MIDLDELTTMDEVNTTVAYLEATEAESYEFKGQQCYALFAETISQEVQEASVGIYRRKDGKTGLLFPVGV
jgi:hypothetical protein